MPDYIVDHEKLVIHDPEQLREACEIDRIDQRGETDENHAIILISERGYRRCKYCNKEGRNG